MEDSPSMQSYAGWMKSRLNRQDITEQLPLSEPVTRTVDRIERGIDEGKAKEQSLIAVKSQAKRLIKKMSGRMYRH